MGRERGFLPARTCRAVRHVPSPLPRRMPDPPQLKILRAVVGAITVEMMYPLGRQKRAAQFLLHDEPVLKHVLPLSAHKRGVVGRPQENVASDNAAAPLPPRRFRPSAPD